jgi:hypothetical protein
VEAFVKILRLLKAIFREVKAFLNSYKDFINIPSLFEDFSKEMEASV